MNPNSTAQYLVVENIKKDRNYSPGETVELTAAEAESLLAGGEVKMMEEPSLKELVKARKAAQ